MSDTVIRVENLGKRYLIGRKEELPKTRGEAIRNIIGAPLKYLQSQIQEPQPEEIFWALKDVSFEVKAGEVVGVIGRNGAGKSTLLKILSRITKPTSGFAEIKGRVGSLLEVGTGFHPELTGRENIYLNGTILGMSRREVEQKFDEIVDFAEVEKFLDTPVKRYSSGMYVRLAFAVAAHLEPEILVVDEVLAVGDANFQKKCLGKMGEVATREGKTVLFVSHNMTAVKSLCQKAIWLDQGNIIEVGQVDLVAVNYLNRGYESSLEKIWHEPKVAPGNEKVRLHRVSVTPIEQDKYEAITVLTALKFEFEFWNYSSSRILNLSAFIYNLEGICIFNTFSEGFNFSEGLIYGSFTVPRNFLNDGIYILKLMIVRDRSVGIFEKDDLLSFEVNDVERVGNWYGKWLGAVRPQFKWDFKLIDSLN